MSPHNHLYVLNLPFGTCLRNALLNLLKKQTLWKSWKTQRLIINLLICVNRLIVNLIPISAVFFFSWKFINFLNMTCEYQNLKVEILGNWLSNLCGSTQDAFDTKLKRIKHSYFWKMIFWKISERFILLILLIFYRNVNYYVYILCFCNDKERLNEFFIRIYIFNVIYMQITLFWIDSFLHTLIIKLQAHIATIT